MSFPKAQVVTIELSKQITFSENEQQQISKHLQSLESIYLGYHNNKTLKDEDMRSVKFAIIGIDGSKKDDEYFKFDEKITQIVLDVSKNAPKMVLKRENDTFSNKTLLLSNTDQYTEEDQKKLEAELSEGDRNFIIKIQKKRDSKELSEMEFQTQRSLIWGKYAKKLNISPIPKGQEDSVKKEFQPKITEISIEKVKEEVKHNMKNEEKIESTDKKTPRQKISNLKINFQKVRKINDDTVTEPLKWYRENIKNLLKEIDQVINIGVISFYEKSGSSSFINTLYRSFYEDYRSSIAYNQKINTQKTIKYSFHKRNENRNLYFVEYPTIVDIKSTLFENIDLVVCLMPSDKLEIGKINDSEVEEIFNTVLRTGAIVGITKLDLVDGKPYKFIKDQVSFKMMNYTCQSHKWGDQDIDYRALKTFYRILQKIYNKKKKDESYVRVGSFLSKN